MLRFSALKPEAPTADKRQPQPRPDDKGKREEVYMRDIYKEKDVFLLQ